MAASVISERDECRSWRAIREPALPRSPACEPLPGLFSPLMRELVEMHYLATTPVVLEDSELAQHLGTVHKTPYPEGSDRRWRGIRRGRAPTDKRRNGQDHLCADRTGDSRTD